MPNIGSKYSQIGRDNISGFSIVEITLVLLVVSILMSMIVFTTQARMDAARMYATKERMQTVMDAIDRYVEQYGHLPCPARITLSRTDPNYGVGVGSNTTDCPDATVLVNMVPPTDDILMGMVPFNSFTPNLDASIAVDGWGNRLTYITGRKYTNVTDFTGSTNYGDMYIICNHPACNGLGTNLVASPDGDVGYILISHGPNGYGAYKDSNGTKNSVTYATGDEANNAATNNTFTQILPAEKFDDILIFKPRWQLPKYINQ